MNKQDILKLLYEELNKARIELVDIIDEAEHGVENDDKYCDVDNRINTLKNTINFIKGKEG